MGKIVLPKIKPKQPTQTTPYTVSQIKPSEAYPWITQKHYAKRIPTILWAFGLYYHNSGSITLDGVITFGIPNNQWLCKGVCGEEWSENVLELNRLILQNNRKNEASILISRSMNLLPKPSIVVSYADTGQNHCGYVYQATNFIYTGKTVERTDPDTGDKHHRHQGNADASKRRLRTSKHRYVFFSANRKHKKLLKQELRYKQQRYPKTVNTNYDSGSDVPTQGIFNL